MKITDLGLKQGKGSGSVLHTPTQFFWKYPRPPLFFFPVVFCIQMGVIVPGVPFADRGKWD